MGKKLMEKIPSDTAVSLSMNSLQLKFLESTSLNIRGIPLLHFIGDDLFVKVTLGGAFAVSTSLHWESVCINCVDQDGTLAHENGISTVLGNGDPNMRSVFWIEERNRLQKKPVPFLAITAVNVLPYNVKDAECHSLNVSAKISGVRLGGGMNYTESLLHRFGVLGPDGGPGEGLSKGLKILSSGPLAELFRPSLLSKVNQENDGCFEDEDPVKLLELGMPDDVDVSVELNNWLFALEGSQEIEPGRLTCNGFNASEERCWHTTFDSFLVKAKSSDTHNLDNQGTKKYPVELLTVGVEGLQVLKPRSKAGDFQEETTGCNRVDTGMKTMESGGSIDGVNVEVCLVLSEDQSAEIDKWTVENIKFSVKQPIEAVATKEELKQLAYLCWSEFDSMGRIAAGSLRLLKLDESIGQATIDQLSNLGTESLENILAPEKCNRGNSASSISFIPRSDAGVAACQTPSMESTIYSLELEILESQATCSALISELSSSEHSRQIEEDMQQLHQKLGSMQTLLTRLRTVI